MVKIEIILNILSIIFVSIGNLMDITDTEKFLNISKYGYWINSIFFILMVIVMKSYK